MKEVQYESTNHQVAKAAFFIDELHHLPNQRPVPGALIWLTS